MSWCTLGSEDFALDHCAGQANPRTSTSTLSLARFDLMSDATSCSSASPWVYVSVSLMASPPAPNPFFLSREAAFFGSYVGAGRSPEWPHSPGGTYPEMGSAAPWRALIIPW